MPTSTLKLSDFGGSPLLGSAPTAAVGERFRRLEMDWEIPPVCDGDLGWLIYFIMTDKYPYEEDPQ